MSSTALVPSLVRPSSRAASLVADAVLVAIGVALIGLSAQVTFHLPNTPVPFTGQTFAVLLVGGAYGATRGFATMAAYLVVGGIGYGVFAQHSSGWDVLKLSSATGGCGVVWTFGLQAKVVTSRLANARIDQRRMPGLSVSVTHSARAPSGPG